LANTILATLKRSNDDTDLCWPYDTSAAAQAELRVFEIALSKLDQYIRASLSTPSDRIWVSEPSHRNREASGLEGMLAFLRTQVLSDEDRGLVLKAEWLIARSRRGDNDNLLQEANSILAQVFVKAVRGSF
jgi:hypothetical protein